MDSIIYCGIHGMNTVVDQLLACAVGFPIVVATDGTTNLCACALAHPLCTLQGVWGTCPWQRLSSWTCTLAIQTNLHTASAFRLTVAATGTIWHVASA